MTRPDFEVGASGKYIGFGGELFNCRVESIELVQAGWGQFYQVSLRLEHKNRLVKLNWSLFTERLIMTEVGSE